METNYTLKNFIRGGTVLFFFLAFVITGQQYVQAQDRALTSLEIIIVGPEGSKVQVTWPGGSGTIVGPVDSSTLPNIPVGSEITFTVVPLDGHCEGFLGWENVNIGIPVQTNEHTYTIALLQSLIPPGENPTVKAVFSDYSSYQFTSDIGQQLACLNKDTGFEVTLETLVENQCGRDNVRFGIKAEGPGAVTFVSNGHEFDDFGYFFPDDIEGGDIDPDANIPVDWILNFSEPGDYTITFSLIKAPFGKVYYNYNEFEVTVIQEPVIYFTFDDVPIEEGGSLFACINSAAEFAINNVVGDYPFNVTYTVNGTEKTDNINDASWTYTLEDLLGEDYLAGPYDIVITSITDGNGCEVANPESYYNFDIEIFAEPAIGFTFKELASTGDTFEYCHDEPVSVTLTDIWFGKAPFNIEWEVYVNGSDTPDETLSGSNPTANINTVLFNQTLDAGEYEINITSITDSNNCSPDDYDPYTATVIVHPELKITKLEKDNVTCFGVDDGKVTTLTVTGGTEPYSYLWTGPDDFTSPDKLPENLKPGIYNVTITDGINCEVTESILITEPDVLSATVDPENVTCNGADDGTITISGATGGYGTYEYSIDGGDNWQASGDFTGLAPAVYNVQIRDAAHQLCVIVLIDDLKITEPDELSATVASENVTCNGAADGTITISDPEGGYETYEYSIDGGDSWQASGDFTGLAPAVYNVQIRDAAHPACVITLDATLEITEPDELSATVASENVTCNGAADGTITISEPQGGYGTYQYSIDGGDNWQASDVFTDLAPDTYNVQIRDAAHTACVITLDAALEITQPDQLTITEIKADNISCFEADDGKITALTVTGGTEPYSYFWSGPVSSTLKLPDGLLQGLYTVTVTDENDCEVTANIEITEPGELDAELVSTDATCFTDNGTITVSNPTGGYGTWEVSIDAGWDEVTTDTPLLFEDLSAGTYTVMIRDKAHPDCFIELQELEIFDLGAIALAAVNEAITAADMRIALEDVNLCLDLDDYNTLVDGRKYSVAQDMLDNRPAATGYPDFDAVEALFELLVDFRIKTQIAVNAANDGTLTVAMLQGVHDALLDLDGYFVNGVEVAAANLAAGQDFIDELADMVEGRFAALVADLEANGPYTSFTQMATMLQPLAEFRFATAAAVEAANDGALTVAMLQGVHDALDALEGFSVNGVEVVEADLVAGQAFINALDAMEHGRFAALVADLEANGPYTSFTQMATMLHLLAEFRFATAAAVEAANNGAFIVDHLQDVQDALTDLEGKIVNGVEVDGDDLLAGQAFIDALDAMVLGRFAALVADLAANGPYTSFTQMATMLYPLAEFRFAIADAVVEANTGAFTKQSLDPVLSALTNIQAVNDDATINGHDVGPIIDEKTTFIAKMNTIDDARFPAVVNDLQDNSNGGYASYTAMSITLNEIVDTRIAIQVSLDAVHEAADAGELMDFEFFTDVIDILESVNYATINGVAISDVLVQLNMKKDLFDALADNHQVLVLQALINGGPYPSWTAMCNALLEFLQAQSTYAFDFTEPTDVCPGNTVVVPVTFAYDDLGVYGYNSVQFTFNATGPGDVTFGATDSNNNYFEFTNTGVWGPESGFELPADYIATTAWDLTFAESGSYNITFSLIDLLTDEEIATDVANVIVGVISAYAFDFAAPTDVCPGKTVEVPVTFANEEPAGDCGYDAVRFTFEAVGPGDVTFGATDSAGDYYEFTNTGVWGPASGFPLPAVYSATTDWDLTFSDAGDYTITFRLIDLETDEVIAEDEAAVTVGTISTYAFDFDTPDNVCAGQLTVVPVTFANEYPAGDCGYDAVRFTFEATGPGDVTFGATDSAGDYYEFTNTGVWGPASGFPLPPEYDATTDWDITFADPGAYTITFRLIDVETDEVIAEDETTLTIGVVSTYAFDFTAPVNVCPGKLVEVPVTFANEDPAGDCGYDSVRFTFAATGPGDVTFGATDSEDVYYEFTNEGVWGPASGFPLPAEYSATTDWDLTFSASGDYTITFKLVDLEKDEVIVQDDITITVNELPMISFGFNDVEAPHAPHAVFEYDHEVPLTVTLYQVYAGVAPFDITYEINGTAYTVTNVFETDPIVENAIFDPGIYNIVVTNITDANNCEATQEFLDLCKAKVTIIKVAEIENMYQTAKSAFVTWEVENDHTYKIRVPGVIDTFEDANDGEFYFDKDDNDDKLEPVTSYNLELQTFIEGVLVGTTTNVVTTGLMGDVNGDGNATSVLNINLIVAYINGTIAPIYTRVDQANEFPLPDGKVPFIFDAADFNEDGVLNIFDIVRWVLNAQPGKDTFEDLKSHDAGIYLAPDIIRIESDGTLAGVEFELTGQGLDEVSLKAIPEGFQVTWRVEGNTLYGMLFSLDNRPIEEGIVDLIRVENGYDLKWGELFAANLIADYVAINTFDVPTDIEDVFTSSMSLEVYPNPSKGQFTTAIDVPINSSVQLILYDMQGRKMASKLIEAGGAESVSWNEDLQPGLYLLRMVATPEGQANHTFTREVRVLIN